MKMDHFPIITNNLGLVLTPCAAMDVHRNNFFFGGEGNISREQNLKFMAQGLKKVLKTLIELLKVSIL